MGTALGAWQGYISHTRPNCARDVPNFLRPQHLRLNTEKAGTVPPLAIHTNTYLFTKTSPYPYQRLCTKSRQEQSPFFSAFP